MNIRQWISGVAVAGLIGASFLQAAEKPAKKSKKPANQIVSFGSLKALTSEDARARTEAWLKKVNKNDQGTQQALQQIWARTDSPLFDKVADSLALGNADAAKMLAEARDLKAAAPKTVPAIMKDQKLDAFFRSNLALTYARALSNRRIYEEALEAMKTVKPEDVVDPASYLFHRAVAEYSLLEKPEAIHSISRLLDDTVDAPERYRMLAALMFLDMQSWKAKDLGAIARKMDNIERRLEMARGGPHTQKLQKEVIARLDELIKEKENQQQQQQQQSSSGGGGNGGGCPNGGPGSSGQPSDNKQASAPQPDSFGGNATGPGRVEDKKDLKKLVEGWGKLPEKERAKAMASILEDLPPSYRQIIEEYYNREAAHQDK